MAKDERTVNRAVRTSEEIPRVLTDPDEIAAALSQSELDALTAREVLSSGFVSTKTADDETETVTVTTPQTPDYSRMNKTQLLTAAAEKGITIEGSMTNKEIADLLSAHPLPVE